MCITDNTSCNIPAFYQLLFYYNGNLIGTKLLNTDHGDVALADINSVYDAAFIFGQEPDIMRGAFDKNEINYDHHLIN